MVLLVFYLIDQCCHLNASCIMLYTRCFLNRSFSLPVSMRGDVMMQEYTSELDLSLSKAVGESDAGKKIVFDADAVMEDASRAQHLAMEHLDGLDRDLCELKRVYSRLRPGGSKDLVNEEENGRLVFVASALDILQEDFSILVRTLCAFVWIEGIGRKGRSY